MAGEGLFIRQAAAGDERALYKICLITGDVGKDASDVYQDGDMPGTIWSVPYLHHDPALCFVVSDGDEVQGYIVGVADTRAFEKWLEQNWWPKARERFGKMDLKSDREKWAISIINTPEIADDVLLGSFPAHLHINLLPPVRSGGWGRRLIDTLSAAVKAKDAGGIHLGVDPRNKNAISFYRHIGFDMLPTSDPDARPLMGKRL